MATNKNITMRQFNGTDYDTLYPKTLGSQIASTVPVSAGGTGITSNPSLQVNLGSGSAASVFQSAPRPGVYGTLPVSHGGTGQTSLAALASAMGAAKIQTGSYVGTGTYGASNPNSLTFNFMPKLFIISIASHFGKGQGEIYSLYYDCAIHYTNSSTRYVWGSMAANISINNNAVVIYDIYQDNVLNRLNETYNYVCIG